MLYRRRYRPLFRMAKRRRTYRGRNRKFKGRRVSYSRRRTFKKRVRRVFKRRRLRHLSKFKKLTGFGKHVRMIFGHYHHAVGASGDFTYANDIVLDNLNTFMAGTERTPLTLLMKPYQQIKTEGADIVNQSNPITNWKSLDGFGSIRLFKVVFVVKNIGTTWKSQTTGKTINDTVFENPFFAEDIVGEVQNNNSNCLYYPTGSLKFQLHNGYCSIDMLNANNINTVPVTVKRDLNAKPLYYTNPEAVDIDFGPIPGPPLPGLNVMFKNTAGILIGGMAGTASIPPFSLKLVPAQALTFGERIFDPDKTVEENLVGAPKPAEYTDLSFHCWANLYNGHRYMPNAVPEYFKPTTPGDFIHNNFPYLAPHPLTFTRNDTIRQKEYLSAFSDEEKAALSYRTYNNTLFSNLGTATSKNQNIPVKVYLDRIGDLDPEIVDIDTRPNVTVKSPSLVKFLGKTLPYNKAIKYTYQWGEKYMPTIQGDIANVDTNPRDIIEGFIRDSFLNIDPEKSKYPQHPNRGELARFLCFYKDHDIGTDNRENNEIKPQNNQSILYTYLDWDKLGRENTNVGTSELPPTPYVHLSIQTRLYFMCEQSQQLDELFAS